MRPLDPLAALSPIARLLRGAPAPDARAELTRLDALDLAGLAAAARTHARGALALRDGDLGAATAAFDEAAAAFDARGEADAARLARCESLLATIRRGPRPAVVAAAEALAIIAGEAGPGTRAFVVATHYVGAAHRAAGDAVGAQRALLDAFASSAPFLEERAQTLNSLGTLYVVLGAFGAAEALLEHAAELHHQTGDATGEAVSYGQLGSAALGRGDLDRARRCLQMQEWLASRVGDGFGRARALVWLADVALATGRPDDAILFAHEARKVALAASPPLVLWQAYAARAEARAKVELGDPAAGSDLDAAAAGFARLGHPLGDALVAWDRARAEAALDDDRWFEAAFALASLGLTGRVAELLRDRSASLDDGPARRSVEHALAAVAAAGSPHLAAAQEVALVYTRPDDLAALTARRSAASRNLARLAALSLTGPGLYVAAVSSAAVGWSPASLPAPRARAASVLELDGTLAWIWPGLVDVAEVARDLASLRASLGEDTSASLAFEPQARVLAPPFPGEVTARLESAGVARRLRDLASLPPGALRVAAGVAWTADAQALALLAGYAVATCP